MTARDACALCANKECIGYQPLGGGITNCFCGHAAVVHPPIETPSLPPRGGCSETGCIGFQATQFLSDSIGRTPCQRIGCGKLYITHALLPTISVTPSLPAAPPIMATSAAASQSASLVPSVAPVAQAWPLVLSPGNARSANDRRRTHASHQNAWGTTTGSSFPRGAHRSFSLNAQGPRGSQTQLTTRRGGKNTAAGPLPQDTELDFALYPLPVEYDVNVVDMENPDLYAPESGWPKVLGTQDSRLISALYKHGLTFKYNVPSECVADPSLPFFADLHVKLTAHMSSSHLSFSVIPESSSSPPPLGDDEDVFHQKQSAEWLALPWTILAVGGKPRRGEHQGRSLQSAGKAWHQITVAGIRKLELTNHMSRGTYYLIGESAIARQFLFINISPRIGKKYEKL
ncbi:hypothetical protein GGX14DRAFT_572211 [Mycena pura]|uniref:Uncharacterized protein n=1 Tax=Mycena pura TaxID=153505 RepID=A0AAD6V5I7_9AGAR|nr:hypothetical protein GGX14DRAFT_572211 [Mycena pura]